GNAGDQPEHGGDGDGDDTRDPELGDTMLVEDRGGVRAPGEHGNLTERELSPESEAEVEAGDEKAEKRREQELALQHGLDAEVREQRHDDPDRDGGGPAEPKRARRPGSHVRRS